MLHAQQTLVNADTHHRKLKQFETKVLGAEDARCTWSWPCSAV
jgi:hypothetical protein